MKKALQLLVCCLTWGAACLVARGDDSPPKPVKIPPAINPATGAAIAAPSDSLQRAAVTTDPIPSVIAPIDFSTTDPEEVAEHTLESVEQNKDKPDSEALEEEQKQAEADHDWMLRGYHAELQKNGLEKTPAVDANPYDLPKTDDNGDPDLAHDPLLTPPSAARHPNRSTPGDTASAEKSLSPPSLSYSGIPTQALLPPLNAPEATAEVTPDYYAENSMADNTAAATSPAIPSDTDDNSSALDIPGMTAAHEGVPADDLSLEDRLPDEPPDQNKPASDPNSFALPSAPTNDVDAFYKKQAASMHPPNAPTFQVLVTPPPAANVYREPAPTATPLMNGLRSHVADPFDYLKR